MNSKFIPVLTLFSLFVWECYVHADPNYAAPQSILGRPGKSSDAEFKSSKLKDQVDEAMQYSKQGSLGYIVDLMKHHKAHPDAVLSYVEKYVKHPNDVKLCVVTAASLAHTKKSLRILCLMVHDPEVGGNAISAMYNGYNRHQIFAASKELKVALTRGFHINPYSNEAVLLLPLLENHRTSIKILKERLASYKRSEGSSEVICINLSLSEMGDLKAKADILDNFSQHRIESILITLRYLKFVEGKVILKKSIELLRDRRNASRAGIPGGPPQYTRLCDEALVALHYRFDLVQSRSLEVPYHFTDVQLNSAFQKYSRALALQSR